MPTPDKPRSSSSSPRSAEEKEATVWYIPAFSAELVSCQDQARSAARCVFQRKRAVALLRCHVVKELQSPSFQNPFSSSTRVPSGRFWEGRRRVLVVKGVAGTA